MLLCGVAPERFFAAWHRPHLHIPSAPLSNTTSTSTSTALRTLVGREERERHDLAVEALQGRGQRVDHVGEDLPRVERQAVHAAAGAALELAGEEDLQQLALAVGVQGRVALLQVEVVLADSTHVVQLGGDVDHARRVAPLRVGGGEAE